MRGWRTRVGFPSLALWLVAGGCDAAKPPDAGPAAPRGAPSAAASAPRAHVPEKITLDEPAMGTRVTLIAFTTESMGSDAVRAAQRRAYDEVVRLERLMSEWRDDSELSAVNRGAGSFVGVGPETFEVLKRSVWAGNVSKGAFDVTFHSLGDLWKFGTGAAENPTPPKETDVAKKLRFVDYRKIVLEDAGRRVKVPPGTQVGLGGIAKGYAVDRAAMVLKKAGVRNFLAQAGGDLYGAGRKPDGSSWVSGVQDPRGATGEFFATVELEDRAFSTAGDYARSYVHEGRRYHHIIDPKTGFPATACRSVTVWAPDAFTADAVDDAVFVMGPEAGLAMVEEMSGVAALVVDAGNRVRVSKRLEGRVKLLRQPTDRP